jgi:hypothetical protein
VWKLAGAAAGLVAVGVAIGVLVVALDDDEPRRDAAAARPQGPPVRIRVPAEIHGVSYVVDNVLMVHDPRAIHRPWPTRSVAESLPGLRRFWLVVTLGLTNTSDSARAAIQRAPRLVGGDGKEYRPDRRHSEPLLLRGLRPGFYQQRRLAFFVPRAAAPAARLQLDDCPSDAGDEACRPVQFDLGLY